MSDILMEKLLGLPEFEVTDFKQNDYDMGFYVQAKQRPGLCPACGVVEPRLIIYKSRTQNIRDMNVQNKRVALILTRRYYRCTECNSCFSEPLQSVHDRDRMTIRLRNHIALRARFTSFVDIENEYQISDTTIRKAFLEDVAKLPTFSELETPRILGIDEICLKKNEFSRKQPWAVIANGDARTVMDMLKERSKPNIISSLQSLRHPQKVEVVTMDMWPAYRNAVYETLPNALPVIDKFHVVKMANEQLDSKRRSICNKAPAGLKRNKAIFLKREHKLSEKALQLRDEWFEAYPVLQKNYELKESFYRIYDCTSREEAERYFIDWQRSIPCNAGSEYNGWRMLASTVRRCKNEIFNYFEVPYTNAFVEGLNSAIRVIASQGRGYDFEELRGKVLLTVGRKIEAPRTDFSRMAMMVPKYGNVFDDDRDKDYGIPFDAIIKASKSGAYK